MESLFSFFFKYRPFFFQQGEFAFQWKASLLALGVLLVGGALVLYAIYRKRWLITPQGKGWSIFAMRAAFFLLLALMAMRPSLVLSTLVPRESIVAVLVDNSRSMGIEDGTAVRGDAVRDLLEPGSDFLEALEDKFFVRGFRFDSAAESATFPPPLDWTGDQTNIVNALERVLAETRNLPLAGVVLFSDGSDNSFLNFKQVLADLQARDVPLYSVGLGPEQLEQDVEMTQVSAARKLLPESVTTARVTLKQNGYEGSRGRLEVREGSKLVQSKEVYFPPGTETVTTEVTLSPEFEGVKDYEFSLQPMEGERIEQNNKRSTIVQVRNDRPRVLYVEGHPRWDYKFIRKALREDKNLRLETLLRTALNKFYRQGIEEETTLAAGFPVEREELFEYKAILFGSVESAFFSYDQMELVKDFVSRRGGGFLMVGGGASFASGKYSNTPIEQILPVRLGQSDSARPLYQQGEGQLKATAYGELHPALAVTAKGQTSREVWAEMPGLADWNLVDGLKPGTTVLAELAFAGTQDQEVPLLAFQRFGRGHAMALLSGSSWRWQMLRDSEDEGHETFWRQLIRWLISRSKDPVSVETERESYARNERVAIRAEVHDKSFNAINDAVVEAVLTAPSGEESTFPLRWSAREDGVYEGEWVPSEDGLYRVDVDARRRRGGDGAALGVASSYFMTTTGSREYFEAFQKKDFLQRLSEQTDGRYYSLDTVQNLPEEIVYTQNQTARVEVLDLWDMPINFMLLLGLLLGEWVLRKRYGYI